MIAELVVALTFAGSIQQVYVTSGPCESEFALFQDALEEELQESKIPIEDNFTVFASTGWDKNGKACYFVSLTRDNSTLRSPSWIIAVREVSPQEAAKRMVANIRLAISGRFGRGHD